MDAFRDHGKSRPSLEQDIDRAELTMATLERSGISIDAVTAKLVAEGVQLFADAFDKLLAAIAGKRAQTSATSSTAKPQSCRPSSRRRSRRRSRRAA